MLEDSNNDYELVNYLIQEGDTLSELSLKFKVSQDVLLEHNPQVVDPDFIYPGKFLFVPTPVTKKNIDLVVINDLADTPPPKNEPVEKCQPKPLNVANCEENINAEGTAKCKSNQHNERFIYVESTGTVEQPDNCYALYKNDGQLEQLESCHQPNGRFGPIVESLEYREPEEYVDIQLIQKIGDIEAILVEGDLTPSTMRDPAKVFQDNVMVSVAPLLTVNYDESVVGPCREGYLYFFIGQKLYREIKVSVDSDGTNIYNDSDVKHYQSQSVVPEKRDYSGPELTSIHLPMTLNGDRTELRVAFSSFPLPWQHIRNLELSRERMLSRCQECDLSEYLITTLLLRGESGRAYGDPRFSVRNKRELFFLAVDELPQMRPRDISYEQFLGAPRIYLEDLTGEYWHTIINGLKNERIYYDSESLDGLSDDITLNGNFFDLCHEKFCYEDTFFPVPRSLLLQRWLHPNRQNPDEFNAFRLDIDANAEYSQPLAPEVEKDVFENLRNNHQIGLVVRDQRFIADTMLNVAHANIQLLYLLSESFKYQPLGAAAELVHENFLNSTLPTGGTNPLYVNGLADRRLDQTDGSVFSRITKKAERKSARFEAMSKLGRFCDLLLDTSGANLPACDMDAVLFKTADKAWSYYQLINALELILTEEGRIDSRLVEKEELYRLEQFLYSGMNKPTDVLIKARKDIFYHASHPYACLFRSVENIPEDTQAALWAELYSVDLLALQQALAQSHQQAEQNQLVVFNAELIKNAANIIDKENEMGVVDYLTHLRRGTNGLEVLSIQVLPKLYPVMASISRSILNDNSRLSKLIGMELGEASKLKIATDIADFSTAMSGGSVAFKVWQNGDWVSYTAESDSIRMLSIGEYAASSAKAVGKIETGMGGTIQASAGAQSGYEMTARKVKGGTWLSTGVYRGIWHSLAGLELWNAACAANAYYENPNVKSSVALVSGVVDAALVGLYYASLTQRTGWGVGKINGLLEVTTKFNSTGWTSWSTYRGLAASTAGALTSALLFWDAYDLMQQGYRNSAKWKAIEGGGMLSASLSPAITRLLLKVFGLPVSYANPIMIAITLVSLAISFYFAYKSVNHAEDSFSLAVRYGPFGKEKDELLARIATLENRQIELQQEENNKAQQENRPALIIEPDAILITLRELQQINLSNDTGAEYYSHLLNTLMMGDVAIVQLKDIEQDCPEAKRYNCDLFLKTYHPALRFNAQRGGRQAFNLSVGHCVSIPGFSRKGVVPTHSSEAVLTQFEIVSKSDPAIAYHGIKLKPKHWQHTEESSRLLRQMSARRVVGDAEQGPLPMIDELFVDIECLPPNLTFRSETWSLQSQAVVTQESSQRFIYQTSRLTTKIKRSTYG
ncbi:LysM peptidoglycan-binding domain-containing protein [Motilimonas pumila]|uniref:LysM peptidoglycan-binding domain-containing protein n=1 Tax=Motilimonas pumila TaxID=2303987 RepID=A0A418Y9D5_9GAMM|nr:LysM peptidoglycan-binding domain-containing protein [Motilimonas pumila]RJG37103.1 LysM peptidoglycan-binding domain-containing protein [Motilimonas pumila]